MVKRNGGSEGRRRGKEKEREWRCGNKNLKMRDTKELSTSSPAIIQSRYRTVYYPQKEALTIHHF